MRLPNKKEWEEIKALAKPMQSLSEHLALLGCKRIYNVAGHIGRTGTKVHAFRVDVMERSGEQVAVHFMPMCGSDKFGSSTNIIFENVPITCKKCA